MLTLVDLRTPSRSSADARCSPTSGRGVYVTKVRSDCQCAAVDKPGEREISGPASSQSTSSTPPVVVAKNEKELTPFESVSPVTVPRISEVVRLEGSSAL